MDESEREPPAVTVIVPCWNEASTIASTIAEVRALALPVQLIVVDGASTDGTCEILRGIEDRDVEVIYLEKNLGKGGNLKAGLVRARGEVVVHQDADAEYNPAEIARLVAPILSGEVDLVIGSRFLGPAPHMPLIRQLANRMLSLLATVATRRRITDIASCYKIYRLDWYRRISILSDGFSMDVEILVSGLRAGLRLRELPVSYRARSYAEGKKIRTRDFWIMCRSILRASPKRVGAVQCR